MTRKQKIYQLELLMQAYEDEADFKDVYDEIRERIKEATLNDT